MDFMGEAIRLARLGVDRGEGGPFGAVIVKDGHILAASANHVLSKNDPTAHAEIEAIRMACGELGHFHLDGCELYATCEPCPMCLAAIHWARISRVHFALTREDAADIGFADQAVYEAMAVPRMPVLRVIRPDAAELFRLWREKADRTGY